MADLEEHITGAGGLSREQVGAIVHSLRLALRLREDHPEIAALYSTGLSYDEIAAQLTLARRYGASDWVVGKGIYWALHGYDGKGTALQIDSFQGLLTPRVLATLRPVHYALAARKAGLQCVQQKKGIHGMSREALQAARRKGLETVMRKKHGIFGLTTEEREHYGALGAQKAKALGKGPVYSMTKEEKVAQLALVRTQSILSRGQVPWQAAEMSDIFYRFSEQEYAHLLARCPAYRRGSKANNQKIAEQLNALYHHEQPVRNALAVKNKLRKK